VPSYLDKCPKVYECALYDITIPVDENRRCVLSEQIGLEKTKNDRPKNWKCCELCKALIMKLTEY